MTATVRPQITAEMARELALAEKVCVRPILRRVLDRDTGTDTTVAIPCGSTREAVCPAYAHKARVLRIQQCAEGWHRTTEPEPTDGPKATDGRADDDAEDGEQAASRRVRSTRRRQDATDLPGCPVLIAPSGECSARRTGGSTGRRCSSP